VIEDVACIEPGVPQLISEARREVLVDQKLHALSGYGISRSLTATAA
jgi:hypothetical protein